MALRPVSWLAAALTLVVIPLLIHTPAGRSTAPAATDVLFVFDTTGSMSDALSEAQSQATNVMSDLSGRLPNLRFGIAQLRDYGSDPVWRVEQELTSDQAAVQGAIESLSANQGGDSPEAYGTGLFQSRSDSAVAWAHGAK
ncbi:MAG TPA: vWA domain-containing protein, partial [Gaiellaceae bacterium]|nr:vWA domain-containing protein [Gaiellaceae bacterium]